MGTGIWGVTGIWGETGMGTGMLLSAPLPLRAGSPSHPAGKGIQIWKSELKIHANSLPGGKR